MKFPTSKRFTGQIAMILALMLLAGCGGNHANNDSADSANNADKSGNQSSGSGKAGKEADAKPAGEPIKLRIELFDRNNTPAGAPPITNSFMTKYMQEKFGDPNNVKLEFVTVPRSQEVDKLNVLMAANQAPDLVFTYDTPTVQKYARDGGLTDLGPLIAAYGPNLKKALGEDVLRYGVFEGKQYAIPARRVLLGQAATFIRGDWLEELGLPVPQTTEEFYAALKAFKAKKPGKSGANVIPYSYIDYFHMHPLQYSFWDWKAISDEDLYAAPEWLLPGNKEAYRFLNKLYNEGLIDQDFPLSMNKDSQKFQKDVINGWVGAATTNLGDPVNQAYLAELLKADPKAKLVPIDPFSTPDGKHPKPLYNANGIYLLVPKASKNAEAAVRYLDWMAQPENTRVLQYGIEGETYEMKDGVPITLDNDEAKQALFNYGDYCMILNGKYISATDDKLNVRANATETGFMDFTIASYETSIADGVTKPAVTAPIASEIKYATTLNEKNNEIFVKVITAKPADFDKTYDKEVKDYMHIGGQQVMDEKRKAFEAEKQ